MKSNANVIGEDTESEINSYKFIFKTVILYGFYLPVVLQFRRPAFSSYLVLQ